VSWLTESTFPEVTPTEIMIPARIYASIAGSLRTLVKSERMKTNPKIIDNCKRSSDAIKKNFNKTVYRHTEFYARGWILVFWV
jgi:hypothetical protein